MKEEKQPVIICDGGMEQDCFLFEEGSPAGAGRE